MPRRSRTASAYGARKKRKVSASVRKSIPAANMLSVPRMPGELYNRGQRVMMRYAEEFDMDNIITGYSTQIMRINNIFDPNQTGVGHQPLSHDQWQALYKNYLVYGAKVTVRAIASGNAAAIPSPSTVVLVVSTTGSTITSAENGIEYPFSQHRLLGPNDGTGEVTMSTGYIDIAKMAGSKSATFDATQWGAAFGSSPNNEIFAHLLCQGNDGTSVRVNAWIVIDYYVWVYEPADLLTS